MGSNGNVKPNGQSFDEDASETTPLLSSSPAEGPETPLAASPPGSPKPAPAISTTGAADDDDNPLPKTQIFLLCYARLIEPIAFFSIIPYINQMLQFNGNVPATDVGFYSGLIESLFSLTQMLVMIGWGWAADRLGRKPVLVFSLVGVTVATSIFGLARSIWQMIVFRCLAGAFAGTILTIRTMISEHSTTRTQARSFSWFAFAGNLGILVGPLVGGALAEPAAQYPGLFGDVELFKQYPYALPSFAVGAIGLSAVLMSAFFIKETLHKESKGEDGEADGATRPAAHSTWELMKAPGVGIVLYVYWHVALLAFAYTAILPVFWFTPVELGGFGFSTVQISMFMALTGFSQAAWLLIIFPPLQHRLGTNGVMRLCGAAYPVFMFTCPLLNAILRRETQAAVDTFWIVAPLVLLVGSGISMSFTGVQLALNDVSPSPETLGRLNALALTGSSALRSFTPALFTSLFAVGARTQILDGYLVWGVMVGLSVVFRVAVGYLPGTSERDYPGEVGEEGRGEREG